MRRCRNPWPTYWCISSSRRRNVVHCCKTANCAMKCTDILPAFPRILECPAIIVGGATDHVHLLGKPIADDRLGRMGEGTETGVIALGEEEKPAMGFVSMAGGLRRVFGQPVAEGTSAKNTFGSQEEHHRQLSFQDEFRQLLRNTKLHLTNDTFGIESKRNALHNPFGVEGAAGNRSPG